MSIAEVAARVAPIQNPHNILIYDLERVPGRAKVKHRGLTIEGDFWDLSGWKHTIGRRIHADDVIEWPRTICGAFRWYGQDKIHFAAEWQTGGHARFIEKMWAALDKADIVTGHNVRGFDNKKLLADFMLYGLPRPSTYKTFDTLSEARKAGFESNTLDALCKRLGIPAKTDKYDAGMAKRAVAGDRVAQKQIKGYNMGDIDASTGLYDRLRPYSSTHPHAMIGDVTADQGLSCHSCWGYNLTPNGNSIARVNLYREYRCDDCGAPVLGMSIRRVARTKGAPL